MEIEAYQNAPLPILITACVIYVLVETAKRSTPERFRGPRFKKLLTMLPVALGVAASMVPDLLGDGTWLNRLASGSIAGLSPIFAHNLFKRREAGD